MLLTSVDIHMKFDTSKLPRKGGQDAGPAGGVLDLDPAIPSWGILPPEVSDLILRLTAEKDLPPDRSVFKFEIIDAGVPPPKRVPVAPAR